MHPEIESAVRAILQKKLEQCTAPQQELFGRLYPGGVPVSKLGNAIDLCERTIKKNEAGR